MNDYIARIVNAILSKNIDILGTDLFNICTEYNNWSGFDEIQSIATAFNSIDCLLHNQKEANTTFYNMTSEYDLFRIRSLHDYISESHPIYAILARIVTSENRATAKKQLASSQKKMREYLMSQTSYYNEELTDYFIRNNLLYQINIRPRCNSENAHKLAEFNLSLTDKKLDYERFDNLKKTIETIIVNDPQCKDFYISWLMPQALKSAFMVSDNFGHFILNHLYMLGYMDVDLFINYWKEVYNKLFERAKKINKEITESINSMCASFNKFFIEFIFKGKLIIPEFVSLNQFVSSIVDLNYTALQNHVQTVVSNSLRSTKHIQVFSETVDSYSIHNYNVLDKINKYIKEHKTIECNLKNMNISQLHAMCEECGL